jgi:pyridoxine 5-phosphate synthase
MPAMARLSVNLNKIALLRNSRHTGVPDVLKFARIAHEAGANGLTVHPRPDERHIRRSDVPALASLMQPWRPQCELNIEGYPDDRLLEIVREVRPEQCTLVPDPPGAFTSEEGWKLDNRDVPLVNQAVAALKRLGCRVILFVDPDPSVIERVPGSGANGIEIYTGTYAAAFRAGDSRKELEACAATAARAHERGLVVNAGHDLNLDNLPPLVAAMPFLAEASIGHELTADALVMGFAAAVKAYKAALTPP